MTISGKSSGKSYGEEVAPLGADALSMTAESEFFCERRENCGIKPWTPDILRHTGISNHLACFQHEGKTAAWAGNSPDIIQRHYKGLVKQPDAKEFWTIKPPAKPC